ncbi:MAG: SDR family NAD(P)-dependent oxidoreductase [Myxococcota bacterium]
MVPFRTTSTRESFRQRYGPWALVAGASEGLGEAFALELAERGLNVALVARRRAPLEAAAARVQGRGVEALPIVLDLLASNALRTIEETLDGASANPGLIVHNAAYAPRGEFLSGKLADWERALTLNALSPLRFAHHFGQSLSARGGGFIVMSSLAGFQGTPTLATYAATKAFGRVLAEALWAEWSPNVDVLASCAGAIATPGFLRQAAQGADASSPHMVAKETLDALGSGPVFVPNVRDRLAQKLLQGLPRALAVRLMDYGTRKAFDRD